MKLTLSFSAIVLLNLCFGVYSIHSLYVMYGRVDEANDWTAGIAQVGDIHVNM
jgi:hypothetical protein